MFRLETTQTNLNRDKFPPIKKRLSKTYREDTKTTIMNLLSPCFPSQIRSERKEERNIKRKDKKKSRERKKEDQEELYNDK